MQASRGNRRGNNFTVRWSEAEKAQIDELRAERADGPRALGPWLVWAAAGHCRAGGAMPGPGSASAEALPAPAAAVPDLVRHCRIERAVPELARRVVLDLCGGSGSWSEPYARAGYDRRLVTLPDGDVRAYQPPPDVWGVLAAPPCNEFSILKRGPRDFAKGLETVTACLRIIALARPCWWAMENPGSGMLRRWLGPPRDTWQPCDFGDPWTKLTAIWGDFALPERRHVRPLSRMPGATSAERAITPPGFASAFFAANP